MLLLLSSFACGLAGIATLARDMRWFQIAMAATGLLGAGFLALEAYEFLHLIGEGNGPGRSAFLSAFSRWSDAMGCTSCWGCSG